ncbi:MAG: ABC transporter ATP-binding protein [Lachnospiraceae bacterium]|jgi:ABC-2 type transport system ATP-binding protein|nr:ABC transporter ATP-binding protein [Lachnospiraceae bacterium]
MSDVLQISNLSKSFGTNKVIDNISFAVPEGSIFGFIGANGAGKTTTMNIVLGFLEADGGQIIACGEEVRYGETIRNIGYLPDVPEFYNYMRPLEYLTLCGELAGMEKVKIKTRSKELVEMVGLAQANRKIGGFSRGMKQRLGIAQALLGEPKLLLCDEPTSALDPLGRKEILDILTEVRGQTTVIFSTHILSDVERICDRVAFLHKGKIVLASAISDLKVQHKSKSLTLDFEEEIDTDYILQILRQNDVVPSRVETGEICLESLYLEVAKQ